MKQSNFIAWIYRMPLIKRWALMHCIKPENVAEHSHLVAVIAHLLAVIRNTKFGGTLNADRASTLALFHECSEARHQDINHNTKYHNPEITREFKRLEKLAEQECIDSLPEDFRDIYNAIIIQDNVDAEYKQLIKAADLLSAYLKTLDELHFGNQEFAHVKVNLDNKLEKIKQELPEVQYFLDIFAKSCTATVDQLSGM
ncbi:5'-deoxynucleotidase [Thalassotalea sp. LPB0316]|uniref:5'-deoxynucleotidase n=1 Tax=Thalassotalea sp. LPB0316 TaxID=2769490 RepID=UPI001867C3E2|nr:5'-deoxynucleotidase [Thalassotalea sp. LPB0316]QOL24546.1 5'-deoxynucleotidase [Thalassotalea sp. LPB0316]